MQRLDAGNALRHWASHPVTAREINRAISGDPECGWIAHLRRRHFPVPGARGVSLGCGGGAAVVDVVGLEVVRSMEGFDIAEGAIELARRRAKEAGLDHRAHFRVVDLNEVNLQGPYDLIMFEQSLHHVDALESLLDRCRDALAVRGRLVINEYVGPDRFQWSDEVERLMNAMLALLPESMRRDPRGGPMKVTVQRTPPEQVIAVDPSEAIHSSRILAACAERFELVERRDFGGTLLQFLLAEIAANFDPADELDVALLRLMALMERELIDAGALASDFVFAVYRTRAGSA
jgi:SAM-dependent methyltransferase